MLKPDKNTYRALGPMRPASLAGSATKRPFFPQLYWAYHEGNHHKVHEICLNLSIIVFNRDLNLVINSTTVRTMKWVPGTMGTFCLHL